MSTAGQWAGRTAAAGARTVRGWYGDSVTHLGLMAASFALALYAGVRLVAGDPVGVLLWFAGGALLHDLALLPAYSAADRGLQRWGRVGADDGPGRAAAHSGTAPGMRWINHLRVPAAVSLLLLLVWFPLILRRVEDFPEATGLSPDVYLGRWLLVTAALFAGSAGWAALRWALNRRRRQRRQRG